MMVISGGQIGVDRAALDAAIETGHICPEFMGWCPKDRRAKGGPIPPKYVMKEHRSHLYPPRTIANIQTADATLVLTWGEPSGGTALTIRVAKELKKPYTVVDLQNDVCVTKDWMFDNMILNVAGPSRIYDPAYRFMRKLLEEI